ncbi:endoribonuclease Dcr-1 [Leguminivora glycinivorella]|uniref:endoribonuclease Dcr-1 n=1 Tax=Leguminivora glycinivorella TaxID=1035111 RepID=UPI00200C7459|nr:endoribonuclease Dcr-1 [Leguminivora glycinivorella]
MAEGNWSRFTAAEGGARLASAARTRNTIAAELTAFTSTRLLHEEAHEIRGLYSTGKKRSVFVTRASRVPCASYELRILTDLAVVSASDYGDIEDWRQEVEDKEVIVCTSSVFRQLLEDGILAMTRVNVLVVDSCHRVHTDPDLQTIMDIYKSSPSQPRVLGLTYPLFPARRVDPDAGTPDEKEEPSAKQIENKQDFGVCENVDDFEMYSKLEWNIRRLEERLCSQMDLAEDMDNGKRFTGAPCKPKELIIEYSVTRPVCPDYEELDSFMRHAVGDVAGFLEEHRYDPTEIYGEDLYEEFINIPNPTIDPKLIFKQFFYVLDELGPYGADKAAFSLLTKLEKLKIKVPYERHFLLLCLCTTVLVKIRCYADLMFSKYSDLDRITTFSTPKVLRFIEILAQFESNDNENDKSEDKAITEKGNDEKTDENSKTADEVITDKNQINNENQNDRTDDNNENNKTANEAITDETQIKNETQTETDVSKDNIKVTLNGYINNEEETNGHKNPTKKMLYDIEKCDFVTLSNKIEDKVNTYEANLKEIHDLSIDFNQLDVNKKDNTKTDIIEVTEAKSTEIQLSNPKIEVTEVKTELDLTDPRSLLFPRRLHRIRGRGRVQRNIVRNQQAQMNPDALCGIVFMNEPIMAKIMFLVVVDLSRFEPRLSGVSAQYVASGGAADTAELRRHARAREDALKKFRMHDCNLLLATSALEEGIDLPRCNLVLRWDMPASYRSHGLCRGRARAPRASCALLARAGHAQELLQHVAVYRELDQIISRKCGCGIQDEPPQQEEDHADAFTALVIPYSPSSNLDKGDIVTDMPNNDKDDVYTPLANLEKDAKNDENNDDVTTKVEDLNKTEVAIEILRKITDDKSNDANELKENNLKDIVESKIIEDDNDIKNNDGNESNDNSKNRPKDSVVSNDNCIDNNSENVANYEENKLKEKSKVTEDNIKDNDEKESNAKEKSDSVETKVSENRTRETNLECNKCNKVRTSVDKECCEVKKEDIASVDLSTAIALINRYCGKLPSDTFTRLAPSYRTEKVSIRTPSGFQDAWVCTLRLPLNCPVKYNIVGHPMPTRVLARRMAALQACRILHKSGELDDNLMPIGKENFKAGELEACAEADARPGTTKRRQYYYKRTARAFTNCEPIVDTTDEQLAEETDGHTETITSSNVLYAISCTLWCALPERYNTRGRRLHAPQLAKQACGVLMRVHQPDRLQIPSFPVYTRSGEVRVTVAPAANADTRLSPRRKQLITRFMRFVFADVLRVRRRGMTLEPESCTHNNYYVVPTVKVNNPDGSTKVDIDWKFLEQIYQYTEEKAHAELEKPVLWAEEGKNEEKRPGGGEVWVKKGDEAKSENQDKRKVKKMDNPLLKPGEIFVFDPEKYREAVVTPWYRNQDQPQFFLVAEICSNLTPDSEFPSDTHTSFRDYYKSKYGVALTQSNQPLLDVDHTSARLNLLTPRYVNRKGVALPVSSERTRRAKRDRLDQKQILVPELCTVHPFAAPLWFATVALPCVLYRINALLIADEIRRSVAAGVALGVPRVGPGFEWPPLDFGWSLAEVLSADSEKNDKKKEAEDEVKEEHEELKKEKEEEQKETEEPKEKTINDILQEKEDAESGFEIGTWDNDMASSIPEPPEFDEFLEPLPPNLTFCTSASGGANWCDPVQKPKSQFNPSRTFSMADSDCSYMSSDFDTDDSDLNSEDSDDTDTSGFCSSKSNAAMGVRIEYKTAHEAEAVDVERRASHPAPQPDPQDDAADLTLHAQAMGASDATDLTNARATDIDTECLQQFQKSVAEHEQEFIQKGLLVPQDQPITDILPEPLKDCKKPEQIPPNELTTRFEQLFPYKNEFLNIEHGVLTLEAIEKNKRKLLAEFKNSLSEEEIKKYTCFSMIDVDIDSPEYKNEKVANIGFDTMESYVEKVKGMGEREFRPYYEDSKGNGKFDFDFQPNLEGHPGPSPSVILQALTMSNANDGINLERLETIGDSFLKFAITAYLYCAHPTVHEGKLSHMRSKQVSNLNLYRLGLRKRLGARMIASKFEPHDNWLPPCHKAPPAAHAPVDSEGGQEAPPAGCFIPYNLITQHSIPDKSIADCVEALIGAYLLECGPRGALLFMAWLGIRVLPRHDVPLPHWPRDCQKKRSARKSRRESDSESSDEDDDDLPRPVGSLPPYEENGQWFLPMFGALKAPPSPLLRYIADPEGELEQMLSGYDALERTLRYRFRDRSLLLQALTHASHQRNRLTDCYQRLEFLGDAILDYLITRHLYEDPRRHSPGALTDLRSALVNNTIFATLAARHGFHKYFRHMSPGLNEVLTRYVRIQEENGHSISEEHYLIHEDELEQAEDVEVPKALGDLFESIAGAIFLDSGMSLAAVWGSYEQLMGAELEAFSAAAPKSPVRELLEAEPDTAKFGKPERLADGRRVRVCVEVFGRGAFKGVGRNYRIAKGTAARCALRHLKRHKQH